ncbi:MAG: archaemetzincin family Zn-dependent metalloprotease [Desulfobacterales bacterium]|jgi:archaemetzincin
MKSKKRIIGIVPVGDVPELAPKIIVGHIIGYLKLAAEILSPLDPPASAFDEIHRQYNAAKILSCFESGPYGNYDKVIGVFNGDLFIPSFAYVFGEAKQGGKHALVSLFRLAKEKEGRNPSSAILCERAAKVALHELGHLYNLSHCEEKNCLMHYSGGLADLDSIPLYFCRYCNTNFQDALARP